MPTHLFRILPLTIALPPALLRSGKKINWDHLVFAVDVYSSFPSTHHTSLKHGPGQKSDASGQQTVLPAPRTKDPGETQTEAAGDEVLDRQRASEAPQPFT